MALSDSSYMILWIGWFWCKDTIIMVKLQNQFVSKKPNRWLKGLQSWISCVGRSPLHYSITPILIILSYLSFIIPQFLNLPSCGWQAGLESWILNPQIFKSSNDPTWLFLHFDELRTSLLPWLFKFSNQQRTINSLQIFEPAFLRSCLGVRQTAGRSWILNLSNIQTTYTTRSNLWIFESWIFEFTQPANDLYYEI